MPTPPRGPEDTGADSSKAAFSGAAELQNLNQPRTLKGDLQRLLRSVTKNSHRYKRGLIAGLSVAAVQQGGPRLAHAVESGQQQSPAWEVASQPNLPANGSSEDTGEISSQVEHRPTVSSALGEFQLGPTADGTGILVLRNPVVVERHDQTVLGVTTATGPASYVLDAHHFQINVVEGDGQLGPEATTYAQAKQIIDGHTQTVTLDSTSLNSATAMLTGHTEDPDLDEKQLGVLVRYSMSDGELTSSQG
jgi:hypothetical protein